MLENRSRRLGVWMIAKKATSTPLNPKSQAQNQGKEDWVLKQYPVFLVKMEESRDFDVFFGVFFFWHLEERKNVERNWEKSKFQKKCVSPGLMGAWGYLQPQVCFSRQRALQGLRPQNTSDQDDLDTLGQILIFNFKKGMELKNLVVGSKVMTPGS